METNNIYKRARVLVMVFALSIISVGVFAQDPGLPGDSNDPDAPIDGGLSLLVAAGVGYGAKKIHEKRKKQQAENEVNDK